MAIIIDGTNTPTLGGVGYGDGTELAFTGAGTAGGVLYSAGGAAPVFSAAGTSGQVLTSAGAGAPTWATLSTAPTTAQVLTATAGLTFGDVGSYAFLGQQTAAALEPGSTQAGSQLRYVGIGAGAAPGNTSISNAKGSSTNLPTGTWRCLGYADGPATCYYTLFLRIS